MGFRERIRRIVATMVGSGGPDRVDMPRARMARLEPARQSAAAAEGQSAAPPALTREIANSCRNSHLTP
jgi:hypothetical protein